MVFGATIKEKNFTKGARLAGNTVGTAFPAEEQGCILAIQNSLRIMIMKEKDGSHVPFLAAT